MLRLFRRSLLFALLLVGMTLSVHGQEPAAPRVGMNLTAPHYWGGVTFFTDAMRHAGGWVSFDLTDPDTWDDARPVAVDAHGWPTALDTNQGLRLVLYMDHEAVPIGDYTLTWAGRVQMRVVTHDDVHEIAMDDTGPVTIPMPPADFMSLYLVITAMDPDMPLRDLHVYLPGYGPESELLFHPDFIKHVQPFSPIRFTDWGAVNSTTISTWDARGQMDDYTWGSIQGDGFDLVPYEVQIALANQLHADMWVSVPHRADDAYVTQLATLIRDTLAPDLRVWVEFSNEAWHPLFPVGTWVHQEAARIAEEEGIAVPEDDYNGFHHYGRRAVDVIAIFDAVFAETDRAERVLGVVSGAAAWAYPLEAAVEEITQRGMLAHVDALAIAPYFGGALDDEAASIDDLILAYGGTLDNQQTDRVFEALYETVNGMFEPGSEYGDSMLANRDLARSLNLPLVTYEAGQHLEAYDEGFWSINETLFAYAAINAHPRMYDLYRHYLNRWQNFGGGTLVAFHLAGWTEAEYFGHLRYVGQPLDEAHKYRALLSWMAEGR